MIQAPERRRGVELLDDRTIDAATRERSHRDIVRANTLLGGQRAVMLALRPAFDVIVRDRLAADAARSARDANRAMPAAPGATLLDVGTGLGDIPWRARELARRRGLRLTTIGFDHMPSLLSSARQKLDSALCGHALELPLADNSVDFVICSQLLHHFEPDDGLRLITELDRIARRRVIISDLRRSLVAASGFWAASLALRFSAITRHDGTTSVLHGFTEGELGGMVLTATGVQPAIRRRLGFRLTASWTPVSSAA